GWLTGAPCWAADRLDSYHDGDACSLAALAHLEGVSRRPLRTIGLGLLSRLGNCGTVTFSSIQENIHQGQSDLKRHQKGTPQSVPKVCIAATRFLVDRLLREHFFALFGVVLLFTNRGR